MNDIEREANEFAMHLLVPTEFLKRDLKALGGIDIEDDLQITQLAKKYKVSVQIMTLRIAQLLSSAQDRE